MHSGAKGKSGSLKPEVRSKPTWLRHSDKEIEMLILKLSKEGLKPSQIGLHLRDSYGIPDVQTLLGKPITKLLAEKGVKGKVPEDMQFLLKRTISLRKHLETNKKDYSAKRGLQLTESKIRRLVKYYKKAKALPKDWAYDPNNVRLYLE
jgi:small subunit ribosomal protein S15